ncbi:hypothetical protein OF829_01560 [Sphingomonas sp. LB-2]|uniref:hypothetical protein n=1 Tax=Sphingomonas caeni TaxID=2984949 RepID=UPI0022304D42|nr:hypothetical protein [Sphingomonas caeni]MCW3845910.1 hypothetical protein [Sphingomonas caeni]
MLPILRLLAAAVGVIIAYRVLNGTMTNSLFKVPDLIAGGALVIAAVFPKGLANSALVIASTYALGVCSVALSGYLSAGRPADPLLMATMGINILTILMLAAKGADH